jgi:ubiquinone/menaquinone biosynthesis C-methylase UbiE
MQEKVSVAAYFDDLAADYEYDGVESAVQTGHLIETKKIFEKYQIKEGSILDLACGTGLLSQTVVGNFEFTGIDLSEGMLQSAKQRGYTTIHGSLEDEAAKLADQSYDFVTCLTALLCIEDIRPLLADMKRIARKGVLITLEDITDDFIKDFPAPSYNHMHLNFPDAKEDYRVFGWTAPTGTDIYVRMIYIEKDAAA